MRRAARRRQWGWFALGMGAVLAAAGGLAVAGLLGPWVRALLRALLVMLS
jgi:hypothetical protein